MTKDEQLAAVNKSLEELRRERDDHRISRAVDKEHYEKRIAEVTEEARGFFQRELVQRERACRAEGAADALVLVLKKAGLLEEDASFQHGHGAARIQSHASPDQFFEPRRHS